MFKLEDIERMHRLTWPALAEKEPRLKTLYNDAENSRPTKKHGFDFELTWCEFKRPIAYLVGWDRREGGDPLLRTRAAYDVAYWAIFHALHG